MDATEEFDAADALPTMAIVHASITADGLSPEPSHTSVMLSPPSQSAGSRPARAHCISTAQ